LHFAVPAYPEQHCDATHRHGFFCVLWVPAFAGMTDFSVAAKIYAR